MPKIIKNPEDRILQAARKRLLDRELSSFSLRNVAADCGIAVSRITYSPYSVADYTIMLILMVMRHVKTILTRYYGQDYTIPGSMGTELPGKTVGLIGGGQIGKALARHLSGFDCRILISDHHPSFHHRSGDRYLQTEDPG